MRLFLGVVGRILRQASPGSFGIFMELANGWSPQPVFASCWNGTAFSRIKWGSGCPRRHLRTQSWVLLVECGRYLLRGPPEGAFPSRFLSVRRSVGREALIASTVGWCPWECWSQRLRWFDSSASHGCTQQWGVLTGG